MCPPNAAISARPHTGVDQWYQSRNIQLEEISVIITFHHLTNILNHLNNIRQLRVKYYDSFHINYTLTVEVSTAQALSAHSVSFLYTFKVSKSVSSFNTEHVERILLSSFFNVKKISC